MNEAEKRVHLRELVANQPDFTATEIYFSAREISGFSTSSKVARKGKQYRVDTGMVVVITELNKASLRLLSDRTYEEGIGSRRAFISATSPLNPTDLLGFEDIEFSAVGAIEIAGTRLLKIRAKSKHFEQEVFLYADLARKSLITIVQILGKSRSSIQRLEGVSFSVPDSMFDLTGYKPQPKYNWKKVPNAKVTLRENLVKDGLVFRHADYLFIHAGEFDHFFVDLRSNTALTVVFQGLLVSKDGRYIWRTQDTEAISVGEVTQVIQGDSEYATKIKSTANSVTIPDREKKGRTLLTVEW